MGQKRTKIAFFLSVIITQTFSVSAQITGDNPLSADSFAELILGLLNSITLFEIGSISMGAIFIAVVAGFYFPSKFLTSKVFGMIEESLGIGRRYRTDQGGVPLGAKGFAFAIAFVSANGVAAFIGLWGLMVFGVFAFLAVGLGYAGIFSSLTDMVDMGGGGAAPDGGARADRRGDDTGPAPGTAPGGEDGGIPEPLEDHMRQTDEAIQQLQQRIDDVEGEDQQVMQELQQLRNDVESLEEFEQRLPELVKQGKLTQKQAREVEQLIEDSESLEQLEERIEQNNQKILQAEENIEQNEEEIAELEQMIAQMEQQTEQDLSQIRQEMQQLKQQRDQVKQELEQLEQQLQDGVVEREEYERQKQQLQNQFQAIMNEVGNIRQQLQQAAQERQAIKSRIATLEDQMEGLMDVTADLGDAFEELEAEEQKGEQMERNEEERESQFSIPEEWDRKLMKFITEEKKTLQDEEGETYDLENLGEQLEWLLEEEEQGVKAEETEAAKIDKEFAKLAQAADQLEWSIEQELEEMEAIDKTETEREEELDMNLQRIRQDLQNVLETVRSDGLYAVQEGAVEEIVADYSRVRQLSQENLDQQQQRTAAQITDLAENLLQQLERRALERLNEVEQEIAQNPNNAYSDFQKLQRAIGSRENWPNEVADTIGDKEREVMDAFKQSDIDVRRY